MGAAAAAVGRLDVFTKCIGDQEHTERICFPFKSHLCTAVATGKFNIIEHKLSEMEVQLSKVAEDDEISARQIALVISNACSLAIECRQRACAKLLLTFLARNRSLHFDLDGTFDRLLKKCLIVPDTDFFQDLLLLKSDQATTLTAKQVRLVLEKGTDNILRSLLRSGDIDPALCKGLRGASGSTPLMLTLHYQRFDLCEVLLANGVDVDAVLDLEHGVTALWHAVNAWNESGVEFLLHHGANPGFQQGWRSPWGVAKERGRESIIELLLAAKVPR
jgi:ankyrin repeat protein